MNTAKVDIVRKVGRQIACLDTEKREWILKHSFPHRDAPGLFTTVQKIRAAGTINLAYWRPAQKGEV